MNADHGSKIEQACSSSLSAGYDEPEILRYSNRQFGPIGADAGLEYGRHQTHGLEHDPQRRGHTQPKGQKKKQL